MRLTCPNCGAQYEVPDEVIPETGRDVQCSNCGDTWFQPHRDHIDQTADDTDEPSGDDDWVEEAPETAPSPVPPAAEDFAPPAQAKPPATGTAPEAAPHGETETGAPDDGDGDGSLDQEPQPDQPKSERGERREIDPAVANVLREEAEREKRARAAAQGGLETQPDLGLDDDEGEARREREARQRMARMRGLDDSRNEEDASDIDPTSRRSLFPNIEEINSSLGPESDQHVGTAGRNAYPEANPRAGGGFRRGFILALLIAVLALLVYVFAGSLAQMLPALRDVLADYVVWVDGLRQWLDGQIAAAMLWLDTLVGAAPGDGG
jgi:predicted Zn finger-like uncharacterized protein